MSLVAKISENVHVGAREYLTFRLDQEEYGIDILKVQEIRGYEQPTRIANAPAFIKGVVNLRGTIVGSMPFCVELDNLKDTDAPIHQPAAMLVAAD